MSISLIPVIAELDNMYQWVATTIRDLYDAPENYDKQGNFVEASTLNKQHQYLQWPNNQSYMLKTYYALGLSRKLIESSIQAPVFTVESNTKRVDLAWYNGKKWNTKNNAALHAIAGTGSTGAAGEIVINSKLLEEPFDTIKREVVMFSLVHLAYEWADLFGDVASGKKYWTKNANYFFRTFGAMMRDPDGARGYRTINAVQRGSFFEYLRDAYVPKDSKVFELWANQEVKKGTKGSPLKKWACPNCEQSIRSAKKGLAILCDVCTGKPKYEYVDNDRFEYYQANTHARNLAPDGRCTYCGILPAGSSVSWYHKQYICVP